MVLGLHLAKIPLASESSEFPLFPVSGKSGNFRVCEFPFRIPSFRNFWVRDSDFLRVAPGWADAREPSSETEREDPEAK
jgi:hypothetical protein